MKLRKSSLTLMSSNKVFEPAFTQRLLEEGKNTENVSLKVYSQKVKADRGCLSAFGTVTPITDDLRTTSIQTNELSTKNLAIFQNSISFRFFTVVCMKSC